MRFSSSARLIALTLVAAAALVAETAVAEEANSPNTSPPKMEPARQRLFENTVGCHKSGMTQDKLLDIIHDIAMHGDLTDVAFTEDKLQTKLEPNTVFGQTRDQNPYLRGYVAEYMFKTWINVRYSVSFNQNDYEKGKEPPVKRNGFLHFQALNHPDFNFQGCGYITKEQLDRKFGGGFTVNIDKAQNNAGACKELAGVGSPPINIVYNFDAATNAVNSIIVEQGNSFKCNRSNP